MSKFKLFVENFLIYGLGGIISKIVPLLMIPIVTRLMPNSSYYGINDMSTTIVSFGSAIATMGMYDAMYRMFFEKDDEEYKKNVCSTALLFTLGMSLIIFCVMLLFKRQIAQFFFGNAQYANLVYLTAMATLVGATNNLISAPTRMQNKRKVFLVTNTLSPILSYSVSIPLLLNGYYLIALPLASVISGLTMEITFGIMNRKWFSFRNFNVSLLKTLLIIGVPLLPNFLIYWVFNSSDKVMITNIIGVSAAGIYSVGSKIGHVSQLIYTAFSGGWQFFSFSTMKDDNQVQTNSKIYEYLGVIAFVATMFMCAWSKLVFEILFTKEYQSAFIVAPYLFLAPLLQMLFQIGGNQFLIIKKTWPIVIILSVGAIVNVVLNLCLIPNIGIEGAAIATLIGYVISDIICTIVLCKMKLMIISKRFIVAVILLVIAILLWRICFINNIILSTSIAALYVILAIGLYKSDVKKLLSFVKKNNV